MFGTVCARHSGELRLDWVGLVWVGLGWVGLAGFATWVELVLAFLFLGVRYFRKRGLSQSALRLDGMYVYMYVYRYMNAFLLFPISFSLRASIP